jgi:signal peptidase II
MNIRRPQIIGFAIALATFAADQAAKWAMLGPLNLREVGQITLLPIFNFTFTENTGVSLGLLGAGSDSQRWMLVALTAAIALTVLVWLLREARAADTAALGLVLGGALGNIRDRMTLGYVVDYADLHFGSFRPFLIFNLADAAITVGVLIILARSFLSREKRSKPTIPTPADTAPESPTP